MLFRSLLSWHQQNLHTGQEVQEKDRKPGVSAGVRTLDEEEREAIARMLREQQEG